jgi:crotonobetainyl-CoA:carnitine CoA-transferase CaiB-like acyl-CoA transferase
MALMRLLRLRVLKYSAQINTGGVIDMKMALEGIKVIDVSQVIAVPVAARHLADFGAEVIHVEHPEHGDSWRGFLAGVGGGSSVASNIDYNWEAWNRNKKSLTLDLGSETGRAIIYKLMERADVFTTNLRLWEREKFGLDYGSLKMINPRIIYGSVTGMGKEGPEKNLPAYDQTVHWYRSGIVYALTPAGMPAIGFRAGFGDTVAGMTLFSGIMTALYNREKTGKGQEVEVSLLHTGIYQLSFDISGALVTGRDFKEPNPDLPPPSDDPVIKKMGELIARIDTTFTELSELGRANIPNPMATAYWTKENRVIYINCLQPERYWSKICHAISRPEIEHDTRFETQDLRFLNHSDLFHILKDAFSGKTVEEWKPLLSEAGIPYAVQQKISEVPLDIQARANNYFVAIEHPTYGKMEIIANPINLSETPATYRLPAPEFSQHTEEILLDLGYSWEDITAFKGKRVIA